LDGFGMLPAYLNALGIGLAIGVAVAAFGHAAGAALFAPAEPERRLLTVDDATARLLAGPLTWPARVLGVTILLNVVNRTVAAPLSMTVAVSAISALAITLIALHALFRLRAQDDEIDNPADARLQWLRLLLWLVVAATVISLLLGYIALG